MKRQKARKILLILMVIFFPLTYYYFSPYLIIMGAAEGVISGSFLVFTTMFLGSLFFGRIFCGWFCPAGGLQELCFKVNSKTFKGGKFNWTKYFIWVPWIAIIGIMFIQARGIVAIDPLYQTYYGISISDIQSLILFLLIAGLIVGVALAIGKRASCHTICWMAPFMIIGRRIRNVINLPSLQLTSDTEKCINCKLCDKKCPMSLKVNEMVQTKNMENSECILCGSCVDNCPQGAIQYSFGQNN